MNRNQIDTQASSFEAAPTGAPAPVSTPARRGSHTAVAAFMAASAALLLAACNKPAQEPTVGQRIDSAVAKAGEKADDAAEAARRSAEAARTSAGQAVQAAGDTMKDAAITTNVNAALARDGSLSALKIDVDTTGGRVLLRGEAPSAEARERATQLAQAVDGVAAVDNQLTIRN
jgi:osmotically-inducible protein OsmY